jgi:hypothetical protein
MIERKCSSLFAPLYVTYSSTGHVYTHATKWVFGVVHKLRHIQRGGGEGFCDDSSEALAINMTMVEGVKNCVRSFFITP